MQRKFRMGLLTLALGLSVPAAFSQSPQTANQKAPNEQAVSPATDVAQIQSAQVGPTDGAAQLQDVQENPNMPAEFHRAYDLLAEAKNNLANAGGNWGGHKQNAYLLVDQALHELQLAAQWAKDHGAPH